MALPDSTLRISDMVTSADLTPADYIPIVRYDSSDADYDNYKVAAKEFISYPNGYLNGGNVIASSSSVTVGPTFCRDTTNEANIFITADVTKTINSSMFYPTSQYSTSGTKYFLACRVSDADQTTTFFVSNTSNALPTGYAYSRAIAQGYFNASSHTFSNVWCYDNKIDIVQTTSITAGSSLPSGHIALVID